MAKKRKLVVESMPETEGERVAEPLDSAFGRDAPERTAEDETLPMEEEKTQISSETTEPVPAEGVGDGDAVPEAVAAVDDGVGGARAESVSAVVNGHGNVDPEAAAAPVNGDGDAIPEPVASAVDGDGHVAPGAVAAAVDVVGDAGPEAAVAAVGEFDDEAEPIHKLLEPLSKEQLINLLRGAAERHDDVMEQIQRIADEDPVHRKIFVHGLGWDTQAETLLSFFHEYGEIEDCNVVIDKISGKSKGYGFILFKHRAGARRALKHPQKKIGNRMTACQMASTGPVPPPAPPASEYTQRKIYVSNVSAEVDPHKLLQFFAKYGEIEEGPLGLDKQTGKPKGFALFVYKSVDSARKALEEPHKNFEGHILHCQKAIDGPKPTKSGFYLHHSGPLSHHSLRHGSGTGVGAQGPSHFTRGDTGSFGHLMAPSGTGLGFNQGTTPGAAAMGGFNPAIGQALASLLSTPGSGLGLTNLLGSLGGTGMAGPLPNQGVRTTVVNNGAHGMQGTYGNEPGLASIVSPGLLGTYGGQQAPMQGGYGNAPMAQGGRGQQAGGHMGGVAPYSGH